MKFSDPFSRRDVLRCASAVALAGWNATWSWAAEPVADKPLIGFSLYGMRSLPVAEALRVCSEIGYECVEFAVMADWPCDSAKATREQRSEWKSQLADRGLKLGGIMENLTLAVDGEAHQKNLDRLKRASELSRDLAPDQVPLIETILGGSPDKWATLRDTFVERLRDWVQVAEESDAVIAIKTHVAGALHLPQDAAELVKAVASKHLKLAYDFSHFQLRELPLADSWNAMAAETRFVHVKDARGKAGAGAFQFLLPGDGTIDYVELFRLLIRSRYNGPVVVEVSGQIHGKAGYDPIAAAKFCWPVLKNARNQAAQAKG